MLEVAYVDGDIERVCTEERFMKKELGAAVAKALKRQLGELRASQTMSDVLAGPGRWEMLTGDRQGSWSARISPNWRLIVHAAGPEARQAVVVEIVDYH